MQFSPDLLQWAPPRSLIQQVIERKLEAARQKDVELHGDEIRARCQSFAEFVKAAWPILEPNNPLIWNWHLQVMCDHLEAISLGKMSPWLIINIPPGSSKSMIVSVFWQAWEWGALGRPSIRFLTSSYEMENVTRDTRKTRDLVRSSWYQALWPQVRLVRFGETSFANDATGTREGVPFASITGKRGDRVVIDDPHSLKGAESETERGNSIRLFMEGGLNRLNDQTRSAIIIVMQRLHERDLTGALLAQDIGFVHLFIPMEFEPGRVCSTPIGFHDPRVNDGDLLDPVRFPREAIEKLRKVSSYAWAGQYQQRPAPREGGMFKRRWFGLPVQAIPAYATRVRSWDLAASSGTGDWSVGLLMARDNDGFFYIEDLVRLRGSAHEVERTILQTAALDGRDVEIRIPQDPGQAGKGQAEYLIRQLAGYTVHAERETGSKETRASPLAAQCEAGNVKMMRADWNQVFLNEIEVFPMGAHDDQVDAASGAFERLAAIRDMRVSKEFAQTFAVLTARRR